MTDERIIEYLRARGSERPPGGFVASVMAAIDDPVHSRSRFAAWMPAVAIAAGVTAIAVVALLIGQDRGIGPDPMSSPTPSTSAEPTIEDLGVALLDAVDVLRDAPGVEGRQQVEIDGTIGSVTWFDWRPNGDQVVVERQDRDVTGMGWGVPDGSPPPTIGQRIVTFISAKVGDEFFFATEGAGDWRVAARDDTILAIGPGILDRSILPWDPLMGLDPSFPDASESEARIERDDLSDGGVEWRLDSELLGEPAVQRWTIGPGGELRSWTFEREDRSVDPRGDFNANATRGWLQYTITDGGPIEPPDVDTPPDAAAVGAPPDLPLEPPPASLEYGEQVEVCEHPSGRYRVTLPDGWWTNREGDADESALWQACELFGPDAFDVALPADGNWPAGVALTMRWTDGGCIGSFTALLSSDETMVDGLPASVNEYAQGVSTDDPPGLYQYVIDLSEPGVDCEVDGRFITATTSVQMTGDYEENKAILDQVMDSVEITPP